MLIVVCAVEGNSCGSTNNQLEANVSSARLTPAGVHVSAPLQETEGGGGRQDGEREREMERRSREMERC